MLTTTPQSLLDDRGWVFGPHERRRMAVPRGDVSLNVPDEGADGVERAAADRFAGEDAEPRLDHVEPGGALRGEVELDLGMLREPRLHGRCGMRGRVVEDDMQVTAAIAARDAFDEAQEVGARVARRTRAQHAPTADLQRGVQAREAIALVVVRLAGRQ